MSFLNGLHPKQIPSSRRFGGSHGFVVGHITPEAFLGGTIGILEEGDSITIDAAPSPTAST
jgi:dihydroxyacid dehydratase/phosphogluconate dehydratase